MKDMPKHPRLMKRGNTYWHRASIPADIRSTYPKTEETFSLGTKEPQEALIRVRRAATEVDQRFAVHRRQQALLGSTPIAELTKTHLARIEELYYSHLLDEDEQVRLEGFYEPGEPLPNAPVPSFEEYTAEVSELGGDVVATPEVLPPTASSPEGRKGLLASVVRDDWIAEKARSTWVPKTKHEHAVWSQHFLDLVGDRPIGSYGKSDGRTFKLALQKLPPNWVKHRALRDLSFRKASEKAAELGLPSMSDNNINKIIGFVAAFWNWAAENYDEVTGNPFERLKIKVRGNARDERDPFSAEQLTAIFKAPIYTGCLSDRRWAQPGNLVLRDSGRYWVPLISLFSGARMGEIIQLRVEDVRRDGSVLHLSLVDEGEDQRLKTSTSRRRIPIHPTLLELGLEKLVEQRRTEGAVRLFPDLPMGEDGYYSSPFSKYFGRFLKASGAQAAKTSFHSFRHSFEDACRNVDVPFEVMNALQGHGESGMAKRYGKGYVLQHLAKWVRQIKYEGLDLSHLMPTDLP